MRASRSRAGSVEARALCAALTLWSGPAMLQAQECSRLDRPRVVELFTSQGCSSCPPAEQALATLAGLPNVLTLAYHVDYWDSLGWRDPYSSPAFTRLQEQYGRALQLHTIATPQLIVDGSQVVMGSVSIRNALLAKSDSAAAPVHLALADDQIIIHLEPGKARAGSEVSWVPYLAHAITQVRTGENRGRTLAETNVALAHRVVGTWNGERFDRRVALDEVPIAATHVVVLVQEPGAGPIAGAGCIVLPKRQGQP